MSKHGIRLAPPQLLLAFSFSLLFLFSGCQVNKPKVFDPSQVNFTVAYNPNLENQFYPSLVLGVASLSDLNYSLTAKVDRDNGSGYMLRGTVYTPDDRYLLVGCMGGAGGIGVQINEQLKWRAYSNTGLMVFILIITFILQKVEKKVVYHN